MIRDGLLAAVLSALPACEKEEFEDEDEGKTKAGFVDPAIVGAQACGATTTATLPDVGFSAQTRVGCTVGDQWDRRSPPTVSAMS